MPLDPNLPANNSPIVAAELRGQFHAIAQHMAATTNMDMLEMTVSDPPTQAEVQAIATKIDDLIVALSG